MLSALVLSTDAGGAQPLETHRYHAANGNGYRVDIVFRDGSFVATWRNAGGNALEHWHQCVSQGSGQWACKVREHPLVTQRLRFSQDNRTVWHGNVRYDHRP